MVDDGDDVDDVVYTRVHSGRESEMRGRATRKRDIIPARALLPTHILRLRRLLLPLQSPHGKDRKARLSTGQTPRSRRKGLDTCR